VDRRLKGRPYEITEQKSKVSKYIHPPPTGTPSLPTAGRQRETEKQYPLPQTFITSVKAGFLLYLKLIKTGCQWAVGVVFDECKTLRKVWDLNCAKDTYQLLREISV
jgi:hypothetical protein